jgi:hypothetical protein
MLAECGDQVVPGGVVKSMPAQVAAHAVAKGRLAQHRLELPHHHGRFVVDDRTVHAPRVAEIVQGLTDRVRTRRAIDVVGARVVFQEELQVVSHLRELRLDHLVGDEVGEDLLGPDVVEPAHRDQVAEPHVGRLVRDHMGSRQELGLRGGFVEQQALGPVGDVAGMFHGPRLERRHQYEVELAERIGNAGVALERLERLRVQVEQHFAIARELGGIGLAMEHAHRATGAGRGLDLHIADDEGHHVGRQRLGGLKPHSHPVSDPLPVALRAVGDRLPLGRVFQREGPAPLQIGLVEARDRASRIGRHEPGVEQVVAAVERRVAGSEVDSYRVLAAAQPGRGNHEMAVDHASGNRDAIGGDDCLVGTLGVEVDHQGLGRVDQSKPQHVGACDRLRPGVRNRQRQFVAQVADRPARAVARSRATPAAGSSLCELAALGKSRLRTHASPQP